MLTVKEIRTLATSLSEAQFREQMGPFALIQRPPGGTGGESRATLTTGKAHRKPK